MKIRSCKPKESHGIDGSQWIMGETSLEVYNIVYNITPTNNKFEIFLTDQQQGIDTQLVTNNKRFI